MKNPNQKRKIISYFLPLFILFFGAVYIVSCGESTAKNNETAIAEGADLYQSYCAICHGEKADGKSNMAASLGARPLDLTEIAKRRGGDFPKKSIAKIISGAENVPGHFTGNDAMPAWWDAIKKGEGLENSNEVKAKIGHIVDYLETIQKQ